MDHTALDDPGRGPLGEPTERLAAGTRCLLVVELVAVAVVAVLPVWSLAEWVLRSEAAGSKRFDPMTAAFVVLCPFALAVLTLVIVARLRGRARPWATWERVVLFVAQAGGYAYAALLTVLLLVSAAPLALLPAAPILIGLHQADFIRALWSRGD